ncbi:4-(cytidine 5'-diphospho)-2-C-methyl-D-erythritol kinase [Halomonas halocynthiae]|uniref:4-(cytidine 5'-diphospho)-2-C-methyl-D-erythritol kinase n=1 Tax=Halomonas halocynthiae TaxID=176290 RepID=UPI0003FD60B4|nr:4-(cytidine 5'-diphospho)-2-C-methyl-D-erythritol kinase [Halomonas halocynthiae]
MIEQLVDLPAPAKLNRMLHITARRRDGYHELQTLFQFLDYTDRLDLRLRRDGKLSVSPTLDGVSQADNLIRRAAESLKKASGCTLGADIHVHKQLPMGGGLGGGSSNAATTLLGLNRLWGLGLEIDQLAELGLTLGADVPVFVRGHAAWAEGIGERLVPVTLSTPCFIVIHPCVSVSTAAVFQTPQLTRNSPPITMARALQGESLGWRNDCESTVAARYPEVKAALEWLNTRLTQGSTAMLTGTGACLFAPLADGQAADQLLAQLPTRWQGFKAYGLNRSPLHDALDRQS